MPPVAPQPPEELARNIREAQASFFDKAANYSRLVLALGYGGFFAIWSGTKQQLSARSLVLSALLMTASAFLFIVFEVIEAGLVSHLSLRLARATSSIGTVNPTEAQRFVQSYDQTRRVLATAWYPVFLASAIAGMGAGGILIVGFVRSLVALW
jgi:hypothetical protein